MRCLEGVRLVYIPGTRTTIECIAFVRYGARVTVKIWIWRRCGKVKIYILDDDEKKRDKFLIERVNDNDFSILSSSDCAMWCRSDSICRRMKNLTPFTRSIRSLFKWNTIEPNENNNNKFTYKINVASIVLDFGACIAMHIANMCRFSSSMSLDASHANRNTT